MKKNWLNNKTVLLTGVTSGIGRLLAKKLILNHNCHIVGIGRNQDAINELKIELKEKSNLLEYRLFDVSKEENWSNLKEDFIKKNIKIDILINNAGQLPKFKKFDSCSIVDFENIMQVNFNSVFTNEYASAVLDSIARISPDNELADFNPIVNK